MALELTEEMLQQLKEVCIEIINKSAEGEGKRKKRAFHKNDLAMNCFLANHVDLGKAITSASIDDVNSVLATFGSTTNNSEEIKKLQDEESVLREQLKTIKEKLNALKPSKKDAISIKVK